jgi:alpha,alpha-trehalose phosphorylase
MYRYGILESARQRARELNIEKGALFPWRTIGGEECSAYYPAGTAQYHINADIAYAVKQYHLVTNDTDFLKYYGAEVVLEGARVWLSIGHYDSMRNNQFCICSVTGPDEYTAVVNNNFYTNIMAKNHLQFACDIYEWLKVSDPQYAEVLSLRIGLDEQEVKDMASAAANMYLPYDENLGINPQDDAFLNKPDWDFAGVPPEKYPLLLHFHPLVIYRHKVCKQADTVLALLLLNDQFTQQQKKNNFDFYEAITTHDSTLSACIHSIIANEVGYSDKALQYFNEVVRMDLDNRHNNTQHGIHTACMGGAWLCIVQGFAGMRIHDNKLIFCPTYEKEIGGYTFQLKFRGRELQVKVSSTFAEYKLLSGDPIVIKHFGEDVLVKEEKVLLGLLNTQVVGEAL